MTDSETMGPISYLVVEFPGSKMTGEGFPILVDLVDQGIIRILDLVFVTVSEGGVVTRLELADLDGDGELDLSVFQGVSSGLLDDSDLSDAGRVLKAGSSAGILVFENRWAEHLHRRASPWWCDADRCRLHPPGRSAFVARRDGRLTLDEGAFSCQDCCEESPAPRSLPGRPPPCPTMSHGARPTDGHSRNSSLSTRPIRPRPAAARGGRPGCPGRHGRSTTGARRPEGQGHTHRCRVRDTEGQTSGDVARLRPLHRTSAFAVQVPWVGIAVQSMPAT